MNTALMFSSETDLWSTPQAFYDELNREFRFTLDPCSNGLNAKCERHFTVETDGMSQPWVNTDGTPATVFMNPPYGRFDTPRWMKKAYEESLNGATVVCLVPARTETRWFHNYVYGKAEIRFVKGRLKFGGAKDNAPFPSIVVIYRPDLRGVANVDIAGGDAG